MPRDPKPVMDAERTATSSAVRTRGGGGTAHATMAHVPQLVQPPKSSWIKDKFDRLHLSARSRPLPADQVQAYMQWWTFEVTGCRGSATPTNGPDEGGAPQQLLEDWYGRARQLCIAALKHKPLPLALTNTLVLREFFNLLHPVIANCTMLLNLPMLIQYCQAFTTLETYFGKKIGRIKRLYERAMTIFAPPLFKDHACRDGRIIHVPGYLPPIVRLWSFGNVSYYGGSVNYVDQSAIAPHEIFTVEANLNDFLDNIEKALWVLECNMSMTVFADGKPEDIIAIRAIMDIAHDVPVMKGLFQQGLPDINSMPGLVVDLDIMSDMFAKCVMIRDTHGGILPDENAFFPVYGMSGHGFQGLVPVKGFQAKTVLDNYDCTYLGAPKFGLLDDDPGLLSTAKTDPWMLYGTDTPLDIGAQNTDLFTREDGWVSVGADVVDFGDGESIRNFLNTGHPLLRHIWRDMMFIGQWDAAQEYRSLDTSLVAYTAYLDPETFGGDTAQIYAEALGVPYLQ